MSEKFTERKFRAYKKSCSSICDECGKRLSSADWVFERVEKGHYGDISELTGKRIKHIDEKITLCGDCVDVEKVTKKSKEYVGDD